MISIDMQNPDQRTIFAVAQARGQLRILKAGMTIRGTSRKEIQRRLAGWIDSPLRSGRQVDLSITDATEWLAIHNPRGVDS